MRVLQISHRHHVAGGSDAVFFETSALLRDAGHEVIPFCMDDPKNTPTPWSQFFPQSADTRRMPLRDLPRYFYNHQARSKLSELLDHVGPVDIAHLHIYHGKQTPAILPVLRRHGIPVVQSLHEYKLACPVYTLLRDGNPCELCVTGSALNGLRHRCKDGSFLRTLVMTAEMATSRLLGDVRLVDRFICVSDFQRRIMKRAGIPAGKLVTLHNFAEVPAHQTRPADDGSLLYFGRIEKLKGLPTLLDAVARTGHRLVIAGDGAWRDELERIVEHTENVDYIGFQDRDSLARLIRKAKAVVVPSTWYENCPMSVLEAKALSTPVIGADIGGISELVRDGRDGFLFAPGDVGALVGALHRLDRHDHQALCAQARQDALKRFSRQQHLLGLLAIYQDLSSEMLPAGLQPV